ncbi:MAG: toast rack family protein, partial [Candidatus Aminicenantes bacterium]|nr:toast rack family protein [Candidatus Aminicenantes bacterium]
MKKTNIGLGILVIIAGLILMNAERVEDLIEESHSVQLDGLVSARVILDTGIAKLNVSGGADGLLNGSFSYNVKRWQPEIIKEWEGARAVVTVRQKKSTRIPIGHTQNHWNVELNEHVPIDLHVDLGIGESRLDLAGLDLEGLNVDVGIGEVWIDLSG